MPGSPASALPRDVTRRPMPHAASRTRPMIRTGALIVVLAVSMLGAVGCRNARAGAKCSPGFAQQGNYVLICKSGRWARWATKAVVAQNLIAAATAKAGANRASGAGGGGGSGAPSTSGFSATGAALPDDATCAAAVHPAGE